MCVFGGSHNAPLRGGRTNRIRRRGGARCEIVALHVDAFDTDRRAGWSVFVTGAVEQAANRVGAGNISRAPWLPDSAGYVIAVSTDLLWGQRFGTANDAFGER